MKYTLMHKNISVLEMELDELTGFILKISKVYDPGHLPFGIASKTGDSLRAYLNEWWIKRAIPQGRQGLQNALEYLKIPNPSALLVKCFGLSLSDQYWIKPQNADITWGQINFFENDFSEDIGDVLFGKAKKFDGLDFSSPDNTSDGYLKKRWKIINGKRCLIKGGCYLERQQPFNEVIATNIMELLGISHVPYSLIWDEKEPYSVCEDFVTKDTELVSAWRVMQTQNKDNSASVYNHFVDCCEKLGIKEIRANLDRMIVLDYIIANEDRHLNNFGLIRNAESLEWIGFAPIYDSGSSLGYDKRVSQIQKQSDIVCKPFKNSHADQIKLVSDFSWIDFEALADVPDMIMELFSDEGIIEFVDHQRAVAISESVRKRIGELQEIAMENVHLEDATDGDVEEDIAEDYTPKMSM